MNEQILSVDQCYENIANQVVVSALADYMVGEAVINKNGGTVDGLSKSDMDKIRKYDSAKTFLFGPRLIIFTKIPVETLIAAAHKSDRMKLIVQRTFRKVHD